MEVSPREILPVLPASKNITNLTKHINRVIAGHNVPRIITVLPASNDLGQVQVPADLRQEQAGQEDADLHIAIIKI